MRWVGHIVRIGVLEVPVYQFKLEEKPAHVLVLVKKAKLSMCLTNETLHHEDVWGSGGIVQCFLDLSTSFMRVVTFMPRQLYPWGNPRYPLDRNPRYPLDRNPQYPLDRRLGGLQSQSGWYRETKIVDPTGTWTLDTCHIASSQLLYRLRYGIYRKT
jgi:hypothetical protein